MMQPHEVLGVAADAEAHEIRAAYVARLRTAHPDVGGDGGLEVNDLVRAYRSLRAAALRRRRSGIGTTEVARIAMRSRRGWEPPVPRPSSAAWWGRIASVLALIVAIGAAFYASSRLPDSDRQLRGAFDADRAVPVGGEPMPEREPIDEEVLRDAVAAVRSFSANEGVAGLEEHSSRCFAVLAQSPNFRLLDYCLAFDSAANSRAEIAESARAAGSGAFFHPEKMHLRHEAALRLLFTDKVAAHSHHAEIEAKAISELVRATRI